MVLQVSWSELGWILVDAPPTNSNVSITNSNINSISVTRWVFGYILPSILVAFSSSMILKEFYKDSQHEEEEDGTVADSNKKKNLEVNKPCSTSTTTLSSSSSSSSWIIEKCSQHVQHYWNHHHAIVTSVVSQWWWLLLLTCKSSASWTLGPLAAWCCLSWCGIKKGCGARDRKAWNGVITATSTTATVASSQASVTDNWHENAAAAASGRGSKHPSPKRYLEIMVHNVAHTDMILSLDAPPLSSIDPAATGGFCVLDHPKAAAIEDIEEEHEDILLRRRRYQNSKKDFCLCRPRFSAFADFSSLVAKALPTNAVTKEMIIDIDRYERMEDVKTGQYHIVTPRKSNSVIDGSTTSEATLDTHTKTTELTDDPPPATTPLPTGFLLDTTDPHLMILKDQWSDLRVRGRDAPRVESCEMSALSLNAVFFPLLAILLPKWQQQIAQKFDANSLLPHVKQVFVLVTGVGTPRNAKHDVKGNSTLILGMLMEQFIKVLYPHIHVVRVHSETNLFRYDENIAFVEQELMPCIHAYRDAHARGLPYPDEVIALSDLPPSSSSSSSSVVSSPPFDPDWHKSFALTLSFADGSHARTHAIQASLRVSYRPTYFHMWQLKTFWHEGKLVDDDIEVYSFEEMETSPALEPSALCPMTKLVWEEMKAFKEEFVACMKQGGNDIANFWLRKTRQPVLAVLLVQSSSSLSCSDPQGQPQPKLYRGTNMEVSMPTGSLCAERNVIGSALADNPGLKREDLKILAVLQVPLEEVMAEKQRSSSFATSNSATALVMKHSSSFISCSSAIAAAAAGISEGDDVDWIGTDEQSYTTGFSSGGGGDELPTLVSIGGMPPSIPMEAPPTPVRRIQLYPQGHRNPHHNQQQQQQQQANTVKTKTGAGGGGGDNTHMMARKPKRTVVVHSTEDKNPLKPCGACNEWLKKIAGSNPYFKIVTFTDKECNGIYERSVQE